MMKTEKKIKVLSLFANVGIAETYFKELGIEVVLANEIVNQRARFYAHLYPDTEMLIGDIRNNLVKNEIISKSKQYGINMIIATPPCQGMSTAGKQDEFDSRNNLVCCAVEIINAINPDYVLLENVPEQLITKIPYNGKLVLIPDYLKNELSARFNFANNNITEAADYGIPQLRERAIFLLTNKSINKTWQMPSPENNRITMKDAIGNLPILDPLIYDIDYHDHLEIFPRYEERKKLALQISQWHYPPKHVLRQVISMMHTPTGKTAFNNDLLFKPVTSKGVYVKGFKNTYKRQEWDKPAFTITTYNRTIGSQNNVHPGRYLGKDKDGYDIYSDPRVLTVYEIMILMSLPIDWDIPKWASENFIRSVIGEGIPPLLTKKILLNL